jgi:aspartate aminotransferase
MTTLERATPRSSIQQLYDTIAPFLRFIEGPTWARIADPDVANLAVGNPQEMPLPGYVAALSAALPPQDKDWFGYKFSEPKSRATVARSLLARTGLEYDPADIQMTNGGFAAIAVTLRAIVEPGDEVIFLSPPWFFYEILIKAAGGEPVRVRLEAPDFAIQPDVIREAITTRTRAILLNTPHNPSGRVYPKEDLDALGAMLDAASEEVGHTIHLLADEPYNRLVFDGRPFHSPAESYAGTITTYSYGKTLLAPGMRIGYIAVPPTAPDREGLRQALFVSQIASGYSFPNALLQHAIEDLEGLSIDVRALERRRDRLVGELRAMGYETTLPEGTFYVMARTPIEDDYAFAARLAELGVLVLPGAVVELPGWIRLSLTASDAMIETSLPGFRAALRG